MNRPGIAIESNQNFDRPEPLPDSVQSYIMEGTAAEPIDILNLARNPGQLALRMSFIGDELDLLHAEDPEAAQDRVQKLLELAHEAEVRGYGAPISSTVLPHPVARRPKRGHKH